MAMDIQQAQNNTTPTKIMMLPWLGYGHLSAFLELAKALSKRNFHIFFCSTPASLDSIKPKLFPCDSSIELLELHLPSSHDFPPHLHTNNGLPPRLMLKLYEAFAAAAKPFEAFLQTLRPHLLIYDTFQPWAPRLASSLDIPAVNFINAGISIFTYTFHNIQHPDSKFPFSDFKLHTHWKRKPEKVSREIVDEILYCVNASRDIILVNSVRELEGDHIDYLSALTKKRVIPVGPLVYEPNENEEDEDEDYNKIKKWLDEKEPLSTVLVSFGSEFYPSRVEMEEIGSGLEQSKANFIWAMKFHKEKEEEAMAEGFMERVGERGMVVKGWVPQAKILKHGSVGGFVSHCGWNSVMESVVFGVPVIGVPMRMDQPFNAGVLEEAGVGVEAKRDSEGGIRGDEIGKLIREVVVEKSREDILKKVGEMSEILTSRGDDNIHEFVAQISLFCNI